jgi:hypothetical protein
MTLGIIIGNDAGNCLASRIPISGRWDGAFIASFLPLMYIVIIQWILFSDYLPKRWVITGFTGCIIAAAVMGTINYCVSEQVFRLIIQEYSIVTSLLMGILVSLPQWTLLKHKGGYEWVLANGIGWLLSAICRNLNFYIRVDDFVRALIWEASFIPLGILLGLCLYSYVYKRSSQKAIENN